MKTNVTYLHALFDYAIGVLVLIGPWLFGFSGEWRPALITQAFGVAIIGYSLFTDYAPSFRRTIPLFEHLGLDMLCGGLLIASPWLFRFAAVTWIPHLVIGAIMAFRPMLYFAARRISRNIDGNAFQRPHRNRTKAISS